MGAYDIVCGVQVKCTPDLALKEYSVGDFIQLEDGIYLGYEGWFSVRNHEVTDSGSNVYSKWGAILLLEDILNPNNEVAKVIKTIESERS